MESNYAKLKCRKLEREIYNTHTIELILRKFLIQENVKWSEHLAKAGDTIQEEPFPEFMRWWEEAGASWELLAAQGTGSKPGGKSNFFGGQERGSQGDYSCFGCGETGHYKKDFPKEGSRSGSMSNRKGPNKRRP